MQAFDDYHEKRDTPHARAFKLVVCSCLWKMSRFDKHFEHLGTAINNLAKAIGG
jgi:hypothetical protein